MKILTSLLGHISLLIMSFGIALFLASLFLFVMSLIPFSQDNLDYFGMSLMAFKMFFVSEACGFLVLMMTKYMK